MSAQRATQRAFAPLAALVFGVLLLAGAPVWRCPFAWVSGHPCPTCGFTRATRALLHGDFGAAWSLQPLVFVALPWLVALVAVETNAFVRRGEYGRFLRYRAARVTGLAIAVALFVLWVARFFGAWGGPAPV